jgi:hypothetical protein
VPPTWFKPVCTRCPCNILVCTEYIPTPSRASPGMHQKEIKSIIAAEARATNGEIQADGK